MRPLAPLTRVALSTLLLALLLVGCAQNEPEFAVSDLPPGDPARGAEIFTEPPGGASCAHCHPLDGERSVGPPLTGYAARAAGEVSGQSAEEYTFDAILRPSKHVVRGYSNMMPGSYEDTLTRQDIADLIAYLLSR